MLGKVLPFKKKRGITLSEFEKQKDEFELLDLGDPRDLHCYEEVQRDVFNAFDTLGMGVDRLREE
jgi:hypothetical protein